MTNASERVTADRSERVTAQVFGLFLAAIFLGLMILNAFHSKASEQCQHSLL
jgi:hypothetical protein